MTAAQVAAVDALDEQQAAEQQDNAVAAAEQMEVDAPADQLEDGELGQFFIYLYFIILI